METIREADGLKWVVRDGEDDHLALDQHEAILWPHLRDNFKKGTVFVDIGAHVGKYAIRLADAASIVYAIEPSPQNLPILKRNIDLNGFGDKVYVMEMAAWDCVDDTLALSRNGASSRIGAEKDFTTLGMPLDLILNPGPRISLMKIDVEGAEAQVVSGAMRILTTDQPTLFIEDHSGMRGYPDWCFTQDALTAVDYVCEPLEDYGAGKYWLCNPRGLGVATGASQGLLEAAYA